MCSVQDKFPKAVSICTALKDGLYFHAVLFMRVDGRTEIIKKESIVKKEKKEEFGSACFGQYSSSQPFAFLEAL